MNDTLMMVLRVAFLVVLIWVLAAVTGETGSASVGPSGVRARIGKGGCGCGRRGRGRGPHPRWLFQNNGMAGEMIPTGGGQMTAVGIGQM